MPSAVFWGPVVREFGDEERKKIGCETMTNVIDCALGVIFCTAAIEAIISLLGHHWGVFAASVSMSMIRRRLFIGHWARQEFPEALRG